MGSEKTVMTLSMWILKLVCMLQLVTGLNVIKCLETWEYQAKQNVFVKQFRLVFGVVEFLRLLELPIFHGSGATGWISTWRENLLDR